MKTCAHGTLPEQFDCRECQLERESASWRARHGVQEPANAERIVPGDILVCMLPVQEEAKKPAVRACVHLGGRLRDAGRNVLTRAPL
jgi:hypothetical protein